MLLIYQTQARYISPRRYSIHVLDPLLREPPRERSLPRGQAISRGSACSSHRWYTDSVLLHSCHEIDTRYPPLHVASPARSRSLHGTVRLGPFSFLTGLFSSAVDFTHRKRRYVSSTSYRVPRRKSPPSPFIRTFRLPSLSLSPQTLSIAILLSVVPLHRSNAS